MIGYIRSFWHSCSYCVEAKINSLTFVGFRFKDSLFEEKRIGAIHILGLRNCVFYISFYHFDVNCALNLVYS